MSLDRVSPLQEDDLSVPEERARPWYMQAGQMVPRYQNNHTAVKILPQDLPSHDRIPGNSYIRDRIHNLDFQFCGLPKV